MISGSSPWFSAAKNDDGKNYRMCVNEQANDRVAHWYTINPAGTGFIYVASGNGSCYYWLNGGGKSGRYN